MMIHSAPFVCCASQYQKKEKKNKANCLFNILGKVIKIVSYFAPTRRTQKLKLMREGEHYTYSSTPPHAAPVGRKREIGVGCNLF
jgi:hypothetical protein